jgi:3-methylfumaryl-CoA hydratase
VTLAHDITQNGHLCVREKQDLVYREDAKLGGQLPRHQDAPENEEFAKSMCFSTTTLFRYSALTFNGHRIHYDFDYARNVEGYDGLVVHGPLLAQHLILLAVDRLGPLTGFDFRAISPLIHTETADFCVKGNTLWVRASDGRLCLRAEAIPH